MKRFIIIALLVLSVLAMGCSKGTDANSIKEPSTRISGQATYDEPQIDKSYDVGRNDEPTKTTTKTTTTKTTTTKTATTTTPPTLSGEDRAKQVATDYIRNLAGYKYYNGRQLTFQDVVQTGKDGDDWIVDATFIRDAQMSKYESKEPINVHLTIKNWKGESYTFN